MQEDTALQALTTCVPQLESGQTSPGAHFAILHATQAKQRLELLMMLPEWLEKLHAQANPVLSSKRVCACGAYQMMVPTANH